MTDSGGAMPGQGRAWGLAGINAAASLFLLGLFAVNSVAPATAADCTAHGIDFEVFRAAGQLALAGNPLAVFDQSALRDLVSDCGDGWLPWLHPAPVLTLMTPFGLLPLTVAWLAFNALSLVALGLSLRPFTAGLTPLWLAVLLAPALLPALLAGQVTLLWMAGLLGALAALRQGATGLAGVLIGCLTLKPTLGLMIPAALLGIGAWRTILVATATTLGLHGGATLLYGAGYWPALGDLYATHATAALAELGTAGTMTSAAALLARLGIAPDMAANLNLGLAAALFAVVFLVWRRLGAGSDAAAATLVAAIPLATPYLWHYDSAFLALSALFLLRCMRTRPDAATVVLVPLLWLGAGLPLWLTATGLSGAVTPALVVPPLLLLAFGATLPHSLKSHAPKD